MSRDARSVLLQALRHLLRPVTRFCVRHSLKLQDVLLLVKQTFLEAAEDEILRRNAQISLSKLSAITGLHRRDVAKLYEEKHVTPGLGDQLTRVIGQWRSDSRFSTEGGRPKSLTAEGRKSEFFSLVHSVNPELNPYTILYELDRIGAIAKVPRGVSLVAPIYMPQNVLEGFQLLARDLNEFISTVEENLLGSISPANLHILTEYDNVVIDGVPELRGWLLDQGTSFHDRVRQRIAQCDKDINPSVSTCTGGVKVVVGSFSRVILPDEALHAEEGPTEQTANSRRPRRPRR